MTLKEADRLEIMRRKERKEISLTKASEEMGLSCKQTKRIWKKYKIKGPQGLLSKKRGMPSNNQISNSLKGKAIEIIKEKYFDYGPTLAREKLIEKHSLELSKETLRQLMIREGIWKPKKAKKRRVHPRRTRRSMFGEMQQIDGSYHLWFEDRAEKCCLLVSIDDATSALTALRFCKAETTEDYLRLLKGYIKEHGRPISFYSDKHSVFRVNQKKHDGAFSTRFQDILKALDIKLICAHSPQAKGRVERANGILQDRLIKELREQGISNIEAGNAFLEKFRKTYNKKFAVEAVCKKNAHRKVLSQHKEEIIWMNKEERVLSKDLSFQYKTQLYQVESKYVNRLRGKTVLVYESYGEVKMVLQEGKKLKYQKWNEKILDPIPVLDVKELESSWKTMKRKPRKNHPWR